MPEANPTAESDRLVELLKSQNELLVTENQRLFAEIQRLREDNARLSEFIRRHPAALIVQGVVDFVERIL